MELVNLVSYGAVCNESAPKIIAVLTLSDTAIIMDWRVAYQQAHDVPCSLTNTLTLQNLDAAMFTLLLGTRDRYELER